MPRETIPFERVSSAVEINKIFLIAAEGYKTEYLYLSALNERHGRICRLLPFKRSPEESTHSAPNRVLEQLKREAGKVSLKEGDSCWLVVDRDSWGKVLVDAVRECKALQYNPIVSAPCFEIWLVLYFKKLSELSEEEKAQLTLNGDVSSRYKYIEKFLTALMKELRLGKYKHNYTLHDFFFIPDNIKKAINEARMIEKLDIELNENYEFPTMLGSQMYQMLSLFFKENETDLKD